MITAKMSKKFSLNAYDFYKVFLHFIEVIVAFLFVNIDIVKTLLYRYNIDTTISAGIVYLIIYLGQRFVQGKKE